MYVSAEGPLWSVTLSNMRDGCQPEVVLANASDGSAEVAAGRTVHVERPHPARMRAVANARFESYRQSGIVGVSNA